MNDFNYQVMIERTFKYTPTIMIDTDEMGEYFLYHYPRMDLNYYYLKRDIILGDWQNIESLSNIKIRSVISGFNSDLNNPKTIIYINNELYLINTSMFIGHGKSYNEAFCFRHEDGAYSAQTERSFMMYMKKFNTTKI